MTSICIASTYTHDAQIQVFTANTFYIADALPQTHNKLVRSVARRDGDDRTVSELIRFQDALERLGLLWTPLDSLDKHQAHELVRNLHVSRE